MGPEAAHPRCSDGFPILVCESPVGQESSGAFGTVMSDVTQQVEHTLARHSIPGGLTTPAPLYSQALAGQVALVGLWWLDHREMTRDEVAAHLVDLAWNGLSGLETDPVLRGSPRLVAVLASTDVDDLKTTRRDQPLGSTDRRLVVLHEQPPPHVLAVPADVPGRPRPVLP